MTRTRLFALLPAVLVTTALSGVPVATAQGAETDETTTTTSSGTTAASPTVTVLDRGAAPRSQLRYTLPAGTTQTVRMRTFTRISQQQGEQVRSGSTPNIVFTVDIDVPEVAADGTLTLSTTYTSIEAGNDASDSEAEQIDEAVAPLIGMTLVSTMTPTGEVLSTTFDIPEGLDDTTTQLFDQLSSQASALAVPFPRPAMGNGGRWRTETEVELSGIALEQQATYTIERARNGRFTLDVDIDQRAGRQRFTPPGSDEEYTLISSRATGSGRSVLEPGSFPLLLEGRSDIELRQRLRIDGDLLRQTTRTSAFINEER